MSSQTDELCYWSSVALGGSRV